MRLRFFAPLLVSCLLVFGCSDDKKKVEDPEPDPYMKQTSITNCLFNLKLSYTQRNVGKYSNLLGENYTYIFDPRDVGTHGIPESWGRADEVRSATHMLDTLQNTDGYVCQSIGLNFVAGAETRSEVDTTWTEVTLAQIQLLVDARHKETHEPLRYEVIGDQATLSFRQTSETDPASGLRIWKIVRWVDKPIGPKSVTESTTWGKIKASWL